MNDTSPLRGIKNGGGGEAEASAAVITDSANKIIYKPFNLRKVMIKKKAYDEASVIRSLSKKNSVRISIAERKIEIIKNATDIGNGSWGKIDYLHKVHGYIPVFVSSINKKKINNTDDDTVNVGNNKTAKREAKFNMAAMSKNAMRKAKNKQ